MKEAQKIISDIEKVRKSHPMNFLWKLSEDRAFTKQKSQGKGKNESQERESNEA